MPYHEIKARIPIGHARCSTDVFAGVIEHSVYVAAQARGRSVDTVLLNALTDSSESAGICTIQSGIFPENAANSFHCEYREVDRPHRLVMTFVYEGAPEYVSVDTVTFQAVEGTRSGKDPDLGAPL